MRKPFIPMLEENSPRQGFVEHGEFLGLREALPEHLRDPITFLYLSGWRVGEMKSLEWADVNGDRTMVRLSPEKSKNKEGRALPLTGELAEIFARAAAARRMDNPLVFHTVGRISEARGPVHAPRWGWASYWFMICERARSATWSALEFPT